MKRLAQQRGYTIVEVMIFLVITGALLASALLVFNGRQQRTQFTQGVRELDAQIRTIINETASGYYPTKDDIRCTSEGDSLVLYPSQPGTEQGSNKGCLFLGRVIQFNTGSDYRVYTIVGQSHGTNDQAVTTIGDQPGQALQTLVTPTPAQPTLADATVTFKLPWGITVTKVAPPPPAAAVGAIGFISSLGPHSGGGGGDVVSGTSNLNLVPLAGTNLATALANLAQDAVTGTRNLESSQQNPGKIVICLLSGGGDRQAAIIIGGNNNNTGTEVIIDNVPGECD